jgi:hypothetical protein
VLHEVYGNLNEGELILREGLLIAPDQIAILISLGKLQKERHDEPVRKGERPGEKTKMYRVAREYFCRAERVLKERLQRSGSFNISK